MRTALDTPWSLAGSTPVLPARAAGPIPATAAPIETVATAGPVALVTPWAAADVRLPAQATALPALALGAVLPTPRPTVDLREPSRLLA